MCDGKLIQIKNEYQRGAEKRQKVKLEYDGETYHRVLRPDPSITRDSLEVMMSEYFKAGGKIKKYDADGNFIGFTE